MSERRGCAAMRFDRSTHRYRPIRDDQAAPRKRMKEIASVRFRYGYRRIHVLLRREGWAVNHKRVQRLYREEGLNLRQRRPRRHVMAARRVGRQGPTHANEIRAELAKVPPTKSVECQRRGWTLCPMRCLTAGGSTH